MVNILIVEDSITDVQMYKDAIIPIENVKLTFAESGEEALTMIEKVEFSIFFLDVQLPGINGFELARRIRDIPKYTLAFIVFITGYSKNQLDVFKELHCYDYMVKPFSMEVFASKLMDLIYQVSKLKIESEKIKMVLFSTCNGDYLINPNEILYAETQRNYCYLYTENEVFRLAGVSLKEIINTVDDEFFLRCHKSFAVNIKIIFGIRAVNYRLWQIVFKDNQNIVDLSSKYYNIIVTKYKLLADRKV